MEFKVNDMFCNTNDTISISNSIGTYNVVKYEKLKENAKVPTFGTPDSAGADLYACIDEAVIIPPGECRVIGTGLAIESPKGYFGGIFARSGTSIKEGLRPANCIGVCDTDYRGEYLVALYNDSNEARVVEPGDRIAQLIFVQCLTEVKFFESKLSDTKRGDGGLGSTGKK